MAASEPVGCRVVGCLADWAAAIAALDDGSRLPSRTVVVPTEAHAHQLRVELLQSHPRGLVGARFVTLEAAARAVLEHAKVAFHPGEEIRRPLRLRQLARQRELVAYLGYDLDTPGWGEAFATTIEQLESGGLRPDDLALLNDDRATGLAAAWRCLDLSAGGSWTGARITAEAAFVLAADPCAWPYAGPTLALTTPGNTSVEARFLRATPSITLAAAAARPNGDGVVARMASQYGDVVAAAHARWNPVPAPASSELALASALLFASPTALAAPDRPRSGGPDGTVSIESHAGGAEELDATAAWVVDEVYRHGTPLQDLAVLVTSSALAPRVSDRLAELSWLVGDVTERDRPRPTYLAPGRPVGATPSGSRFLMVLRALDQHLPADAMIALLAKLRRVGDERPLSPRRARAAVAALGGAGGTEAFPEGALRWSRRLSELDRDARTRGVGPAIEGLLEVAALVHRGGDVLAIWRAVTAFARTHLVVAAALSDVLEPLDAELRALGAERVCEDLMGPAALRLIIDRVTAASHLDGRFGEPAVFVGTIAEAAGLEFTAVRIVGLAEGMYPGTLRRDALLVPELRQRLPRHSIITAASYAESRSHLLHRVIRGARSRLVLSVPRDIAGSEREPASVIHDVVAALGRPHAVTGARPRAIPRGEDLERDAFRPARAARLEQEIRSPLLPSAWHAVAAATRAQPSHWLADVVSPAALAHCRERGFDVVGGAALPMTVPGVAASSPISAGSLAMLLQCPRRFLWQRVLVNLPHVARAAAHRIDPLPYGQLLHAVADRFAREHGVAFGRREQSLTSWLEQVDAVAADEFARYLEANVLMGSVAIEAARARLGRDIQRFLTDDWASGEPRELVASELPFDGVVLDTPEGALHVHGRIDRVDTERNCTLVRDLKSGVARPRIGPDEGPTVTIDLQLALYAEVAGTLAPSLHIPSTIEVAYAYVDPSSASRERSFRADMPVLREAGREWLSVAAGLLHRQVFVATPDDRDCRYCEFAPVCTDRAMPAPPPAHDAHDLIARYREIKS